MALSRIGESPHAGGTRENDRPGSKIGLPPEKNHLESSRTGHSGYTHLANQVLKHCEFAGTRRKKVSRVEVCATRPLRSPPMLCLGALQSRSWPCAAAC